MNVVCYKVFDQYQVADNQRYRDKNTLEFGIIWIGDMDGNLEKKL